MSIVSVPRARTPVGFVLHLQLKQQQLGLGEGKMASYLGLDRSQWYLIRKAKAEPSRALVRRVMREWPEEFEPFLPEWVLAGDVEADVAPVDGAAEDPEALPEAG